MVENAVATIDRTSTHLAVSLVTEICIVFLFYKLPSAIVFVDKLIFEAALIVRTGVLDQIVLRVVIEYPNSVLRSIRPVMGLTGFIPFIIVFERSLRRNVYIVSLRSEVLRMNLL